MDDSASPGHMDIGAANVNIVFRLTSQYNGHGCVQYECNGSHTDHQTAHHMLRMNEQVVCIRKDEYRNRNQGEGIEKRG